MNDLTITSAKMICKSIDALTHELYMLRMDIKNIRSEKEIIEQGEKGSPPYDNRA